MNRNNNINTVGFWSGVTAFSFAVSFGLGQVLQVIGLLTYPWDEILIYGFSLCIVIPFLMEMLALHYITAEEDKFWSHAALIFTVLYVVFVTPNYVVQLTTVIPMTFAGHGSQIILLKQTPHSMFWDFDAIGYVFMGLATFSAIPLLKNDQSRWLRYSFIAHSLVTPLIAFVYFYPTYSESLLFMASPWLITAPLSMLLLAMKFRMQSGPTGHKQSLFQPFYTYKATKHLLINKN